MPHSPLVESRAAHATAERRQGLRASTGDARSFPPNLALDVDHGMDRRSTCGATPSRLVEERTARRPPPSASSPCRRVLWQVRDRRRSERRTRRHARAPGTSRGREGAHRGPAAAFGAASAARPARTCGPRPSRAETTRSAPALSPVVHAAVPVRRSVVAERALYGCKSSCPTARPPPRPTRSTRLGRRRRIRAPRRDSTAQRACAAAAMKLMKLMCLLPRLLRLVVLPPG
mmetsp:Transcript_13809/g.35146  ORF Transcript_13809/g.35146 Transcript_13809/m.35146 type:complete len:231 (-) Transcript_13809:4-696(-)